VSYESFVMNRVVVSSLSSRDLSEFFKPCSDPRLQRFGVRCGNTAALVQEEKVNDAVDTTDRNVRACPRDTDDVRRSGRSSTRASRGAKYNQHCYSGKPLDRIRLRGVELR